MISHGYWLSLKGQRGGDVQGAARIGSGFESRYAVIASARCLNTPYGFWGTKIIGGGIIVRQRHTYPNSELCAERNTLAIKFFCRRGAVAGRA